MRHFIFIVSLLCVILCSCSTQRQVEPRRYQTMSQKANATLQLDEHQYTINCSVMMWRNESIVISLQPIMGIEMFRMEATADSVLVVDKMNRRYTTLAYDWISKEIRPAPSLKMIQDYITTPLMTKKKLANRIEFEANGHKMSFECIFSAREYNKLTNHRRIDLKKYKRVTLREILPI